MKRIEAAMAAEEHFSISRDNAGLRFKLPALQTIFNTIIFYLTGNRIESRDPFVRAYPQVTVFVLKDSPDHIIRKAILFVESIERLRLAVETIEPLPCSKPQVSLVIKH